MCIRDRSITIKSLEKGKTASMMYRFLIEGEYHELLVNARMQLIRPGVTFVVMNIDVYKRQCIYRHRLLAGLRQWSPRIY